MLQVCYLKVWEHLGELERVQKLGAEEPQLTAALLLCPWLQMTLKNSLSPFTVQTHGVHQSELVFQCFSWAKNTLS